MKHTHWLDETGRGAEGGPQWEIAQVLIDPEDHNDWEARFTVPLEKSRAENRAVVQFDSVAMIGGDFPAGSLTQPSA